MLSVAKPSPTEKHIMLLFASLPAQYCTKLENVDLVCHYNFHFPRMAKNVPVSLALAGCILPFKKPSR
jgi:hypothetical protein